MDRHAVLVSGCGVCPFREHLASGLMVCSERFPLACEYNGPPDECPLRESDITVRIDEGARDAE